MQFTACVKGFFSFSRALKHSSSSLLALADNCLWQGRKGSIPKVTRLCQKWEQAEADIQQAEQSISDSQGLLANSLDTLCAGICHQCNQIKLHALQEEQSIFID